MGLIECGEDENGKYIELKNPQGETPICFIDKNGVEHDTVRLYHWKAVRRDPVKVDICVMCGEVVPEGSMVCKKCWEEVMCK